MDKIQICSKVDHTLLSQIATWDEIAKLCKDAIEYKTASVCIPPSYVKKVKDDAYFLQTSRYIHLNPVKAHMVAHPEDYIWSSYRTILGMTDDRMTERDRTLNYFKSPETKRYRDFVEDIGHKYIVTETEIHRQIEEDEEWLPW